MREDLSAETLDVVYDGSKMTLGALFSIFQIASSITIRASILVSSL